MIPRIKEIKPMPEQILWVSFDSGEQVLYDVKEDIAAIKDFLPLKTEIGLFQNFQLDASRTCVTWSEKIDLPSDTILEYGKRI